MTTASVPAVPATPAVSVPGLSVRTLSARLALGLILAMQAIVSLVSLHNSAFQDEALYLYAGRQIIHHWLGGPAPLDHYALYFSGYPAIYPVIGGFLDMVGGLALARAFSTACMLGVTTLVYYVANRILPRPSAIFAAALYASLGTVLFVGRLATFDALCLLLVALSVALAFRAKDSGRPWAALMIGPTMALAILAKYAGLLFVPAVGALLAYQTFTAGGWRRALRDVGLGTLTLGASLGLAAALADPAAFHAIAGSTTNRTPIMPEPRLELAGYVLYMGGVVFALAVIGLAVWARRRGQTVLGLILFGSSLLVPAYHIDKGESIALEKHMAFALFFVAPLAGYALGWLSGYARRVAVDPRRGQWLVGVAVVVAVLSLGLRQAEGLYAGWANTSELATVLHTQLRVGSGRILAEDIEVTRFDAQDITQQWQWNGLQFFTYYEHGLKRPPMLGNPALQAAIDNGYFAFVELSFNYQISQANFVAAAMAASRNYDLIAVVPFQNSFGRGHFFLFRLALTPKHGTFTNVLQVKTTTWYHCIKPVCLP